MDLPGDLIQGMAFSLDSLVSTVLVLTKVCCVFFLLVGYLLHHASLLDDKEKSLQPWCQRGW